MFTIVFFGSVSTALADSIYSFTTIDVPGANGTTAASGINDSSQILGSFTDATGEHGFLASPGSLVPEPLVVGVGDFNGDGHADVLWFNASTGALGYWLLDGQGNVIATPILQDLRLRKFPSQRFCIDAAHALSVKCVKSRQQPKGGPQTGIAASMRLFTSTC
jgi:hypothetical protein